jgi:hypothetical protein
LFLGLEILRSVRSIAESQYQKLTLSEVENAQFDRLKVFDSSFSGRLNQIERSLETKIWEFELWVANVRKAKEPTFLPGVQFLTALISNVKDLLPPLKDAIYFVYVDEFENLLQYQQRILNTCIKHSELPLIFNIAMKRYAFETLKTVGTESIQNIADYREHDLEQYVLAADFQIFAAEVLFLNLALAGIRDVPVEPATLRDPSKLNYRRERDYRERVLTKIREVFPGLSHEELGKAAFQNESIKRKIRDRIEKALQSRTAAIDIEKFYRPAFPQATVTVTALLHRKRLSVEEIAREFDLLESGEESKFTSGTEWIHNNFIGCLLWLYESHAAVCPFFAGFDTFCLLARGNLRHFLELCHTSLNQVANSFEGERFAVSPELQAKAARQASTVFLNEIPAFGRLGDRLHTFVFRIGSLFALAHRRPTQSEPEQSHFAITSGTTVLSDDDSNFLREAEKWSVIFAEEETKLKSDIKVASFEYILNPIYSPYFNITCRKKRKLGLSTEDLRVLIHGNYDEAIQLLKQFSKQWEIEEDNSETLFSKFAEKPPL